jgi:segregation and condensation protein B
MNAHDDADAPHEASEAEEQPVHDTIGPPPPETEAGADSDAEADVDEEGEGEVEQARELTRTHLIGLIEALIFASDKPMKALEIARLASAPVKQVRELLAEMKESYAGRGFLLDEVAGGWAFRTNVQFAPFVREVTAGRPVRLSRAQVETLAIVAYRQPVTRPEVDDIRGVDSGATLKLLLERDLVRILGKKDEPGRPILYGTTTQFLEFFGLKSLKDLPTLREFTELSDESRRVAEAELGEVVPEAAAEPTAGEPLPPTVPPDNPVFRDTIAPEAPSTGRIEDPDDED